MDEAEAESEVEVDLEETLSSVGEVMTGAVEPEVSTGMPPERTVRRVGNRTNISKPRALRTTVSLDRRRVLAIKTLNLRTIMASVNHKQARHNGPPRATNESWMR